MKLRKLLHLFLLLFADETPENCALFLSNRGLELFMRCNKVSSNNYLREVSSRSVVHMFMSVKGCTSGLTFPDFGRISTLAWVLLCNVVKYYALCLFFFLYIVLDKHFYISNVFITQHICISFFKYSCLFLAARKFPYLRAIFSDFFTCPQAPSLLQHSSLPNIPFSLVFKARLLFLSLTGIEWSAGFSAKHVGTHGKLLQAIITGVDLFNDTAAILN